MATTLDLNLTPAMAPPRGLSSNFVDPPSLIHALIAATIVIHCVTLPFIIARVYVNTIIVKAIRIEDYLSYLAYTALIVYTGLTCYVGAIGCARHMWDVSLASFNQIMYYLNMTFIAMCITTCLAKTVVFLQLKKIFTIGLRDITFWIIISSLVVNVVFYIIMLFLYAFSCTPREKIWNPTIPGTCINTNRVHIAGGTLNVISDIEALLVPAWAIWRSKMHVKQKLAVFAVFGIGTIAIAIGALGLYWRILLIEGPDYTWRLVPLNLIGMAEIAAVIIVGCCPCVPRFVRYVKGKASTLGSYSNDRRSSTTPKQPPILNTFHKYMAKDSDMSGMETAASGEHLQLHEYPRFNAERSLGESHISLEGDTSDESRTIGKQGEP